MRDTDVKVGLRVRIAMLDTALVKGLLVKPRHLEVRALGKTGIVKGYVPGHGGDVWWVQHDGSDEVGAYCFTEMEQLPGQESFELRQRVDRIAALINTAKTDMDAGLKIVQELLDKFAGGRGPERRLHTGTHPITNETCDDEYCWCRNFGAASNRDLRGELTPVEEVDPTPAATNVADLMRAVRCVPEDALHLGTHVDLTAELFDRFKFEDLRPWIAANFAQWDRIDITRIQIVPEAA